MLYYAKVDTFGPLPAYEIEKIELFATAPASWTYPQIQPKLLEKVKQVLQINTREENL